MIDPRGVIASVRGGQGLSGADAQVMARGLADGSVSDAQAGAFAMAVLTRGIGAAGRVALTEAMRDSGRVLEWALPGPVVDKHSTGGIGDTVSLMLAPLLAACGAYVPMISGRGLGFTGGTLDKLEAIPGFRTDLDETAFRTVTADIGCAIVAAGDDLAPADRRLYAIRDESGTVESLDLITASILSKKLAAGIGALVLDVKCGSGAFSPDIQAARALAQALVTTANGAGCRAVACITDMSQPLARAAGNSLEIRAVLDAFATGQGALAELSLNLAGECLVLAGLDPALAAQALSSGAALDRFARMIAAQGGPRDLILRPDTYLPPAPVILPVPAEGQVARIDTARLGRAVVALGGGRIRSSDRIDPRVGLSGMLRLGEMAGDGQPLAFVHAADHSSAERAAAEVRAAYHIGEAPFVPPLILERVTS